jgi:hypothetical protein
VPKLQWAETNQRMQELAVDMQSARAQLYQGELSLADDAYWQYGFLRAKANSIEGGTSEIQRNIICTTQVPTELILSKKCRGQQAKRKFLTKSSGLYGVLSHLPLAYPKYQRLLREKREEITEAEDNKDIGLLLSTASHD